MRLKSLTHQTIIFLVLVVSVVCGQESATSEMRISAIVVKEAEKAKEIWQQLQNGADFAELAKQYSIGPNRNEGGDLGYFIAGDMMKELNEVATGLRIGEFSEPIKVENGYYILLKTAQGPVPVSIPSEDEPIVPFYILSEKPEIIKSVNPKYPDLARKKKIQGRVVVKVLINEQGNVEKVEIIESPDPMLSEATIEAAKEWKFKPLKDRHVKVWMKFPIDFSLKK